MFGLGDSNHQFRGRREFELERVYVNEMHNSPQDRIIGLGGFSNSGPTV